MAFIKTESRQYLTYLLAEDAAQARLEVVPKRGGIITRWSVAGKDLLYLDQERFRDPGLSVRGGVPILFPICGNLPDNAYTVDGQMYGLKQHGFARDLPWQVVDQAVEDGVSLTLLLESSPETRSRYPFDFQLRFTYHIRGPVLEIRQEVANVGSVTMPFSLGLHPYFTVVDKSQLSFQIPATQLIDQRTQLSHTFLNGFDFALDEIDVIFPELATQQATVRDAAQNHQLTFEFDQFYSNLVFWTLKEKDFYCLEPWSAGRNALNTGDRLTLLPPGKQLQTWFRLRVSPLE
ncbi:aldose epimerase [Leptolyngbya sp. AN02str]|uniref:aldose epimerase family protein n=1 Tax=Leptolyngbya sp. AN02str TaxID=3423363 RepID=UPI003D315ABD